MKRIIYSKPDGGFSIIHPIISQDDPAGFTEADAIARALTKDVPVNATNVLIVEPSAIPADRSKRRSWRRLNGSIVVDAIVEAAARDQDAISAIDGMDLMQFKHLFDLENRTRVLEARPQITQAQYRAALIAEWKVLHPNGA